MPNPYTYKHNGKVLYSSLINDPFNSLTIHYTPLTYVNWFAFTKAYFVRPVVHPPVVGWSLNGTISLDQADKLAINQALIS